MPQIGITWNGIMAKRKPEQGSGSLVVTTKYVLERSAPILIVCHHDDDNDTWAFLCGKTDKEDDFRIIDMDRILVIDPTLSEVVNLPRGWSADRDRSGGEWTRAQESETHFVSIPTEGYFLDLESSASRYDHVFCGEHDITGAVCPNCKKPMLRMMSLDTRDPRLDLTDLGVPWAHLLFCWTCNLAQGETSYELCSDGGIRFLAFRGGGVEDDFPYTDYPVAFPGKRFELDPVPEHVRSTLAAVHLGEVDEWEDLDESARSFCKPMHQIGGQPYFMQGAPSALCPTCSRPMAFLASVGDETLDGRGFTDNDSVQVLFLLCREDRVVLSYQECD